MQMTNDDADDRRLTMTWTMDNDYATQTVTQTMDGNADDGGQCTRRTTTHMVDDNAHDG